MSAWRRSCICRARCMRKKSWVDSAWGPGVAIEARQEGVVFRRLEQRAPRAAFRQLLRQGRLADPDRSLDRDVGKWRIRRHHPLPCGQAPAPPLLAPRESGPLREAPERSRYSCSHPILSPPPSSGGERGRRGQGPTPRDAARGRCRETRSGDTGAHHAGAGSAGYGRSLLPRRRRRRRRGSGKGQRDGREGHRALRLPTPGLRPPVTALA